MNENKDFRMAPSNCRDFLSIVKYIGYLAKEEFSIKIEGKCLNFKPVKNVYISPLFFRKVACRRCGCCCKKGITNAYTESEVEKIKNVYQYEKNIPLNKITGGTDVRWLITNRIVKLKDLVDNLKEYNVDIIRRDNLIDNEVIKKSFWVFNKFHLEGIIND